MAHPFRATAAALAGSMEGYVREHLELKGERRAQVRERFTFGD